MSRLSPVRAKGKIGRSVKEYTEVALDVCLGAKVAWKQYKTNLQTKNATKLATMENSCNQ